MIELNPWEQKILSAILPYQKFPITSITDFEVFHILAFNRLTYQSIVSLVQSKQWELIKGNKDSCETDFREDLGIIKFKNENGQECIAMIYDSDELWQDPEVIEIL